jgi:2',3'-cyclic-nucleotide 2'-phosphodiesterase (5'-nucleotidase family)
MYKLPHIVSLIFLWQSAIGFEIEGNQDGVPDFPWSDINLLVITDDHSWLGGHGRKDSYLNADYGEVLSFYQKLKAYCDSANQDLFFVMNGDWIDGTGLSLDGDISHLVPLIQKMPFDVVNTGNHECKFVAGKVRCFFLQSCLFVFVSRFNSSVQAGGDRTYEAARWIH